MERVTTIVIVPSPDASTVSRPLAGSAAASIVSVALPLTDPGTMLNDPPSMSALMLPSGNVWPERLSVPLTVSVSLSVGTDTVSDPAT